MNTSLIARVLVLSACMVVSAVALTRASRSEPTLLRQPLVEFPMQLGDWQGTRAADLEPEVLNQLRVSEYLNRVYRRGATPVPVGLYVGYYQTQRQGETMHSPLNCMPGAGWQPVSTGRAYVPLSAEESAVTGSPSPLDINRYVVRKGPDSILVLYWYQSHGRVVASEYWGKVYTVLDAIQLNRTDAAMVRVIVPLATTEPDAEAQAEQVGIEFVHRMFPHLVRHLPL